ncbi:MAG: SPOR domain-containing protein [Candidatus Zixiibacteriota bacterium]|nr:MAG: SPOR domain-containing protein [candidate division Zixibacteria bacterium]
MNAWKLLIFLGIFALLAMSCSSKKEEATRLEQEMMQEEGVVDTAAEAGLTPEDTAEYAAPELDAGAIPSEEPQFVPQEEEEAGYVVQVAACESLEYAQYLVEKYTTRGYSPYLTTATVDGQTYYRVRVGGLATLQEAKELKTELVDKYSVEAWIDKTE